MIKVPYICSRCGIETKDIVMVFYYDAIAGRRNGYQAKFYFCEKCIISFHNWRAAKGGM